MPVEPVIYPLSVDANIYALCDERGKTIGTGTREACEVLLFIVTNINRGMSHKAPVLTAAPRSNVRAAISI